MYEDETNPATRRAKCFAYGLLVVAAMALMFELGRQRGVADARQDGMDHPDAQVVAAIQLMDEVNRLRAIAGVTAGLDG